MVLNRYCVGAHVQARLSTMTVSWPGGPAYKDQRPRIEPAGESALRLHNSDLRPPRNLADSSEGDGLAQIVMSMGNDGAHVDMEVISNGRSIPVARRGPRDGGALRTALEDVENEHMNVRFGVE